VKIYFAHPMSDYGTEREKICLEKIQNAFPGGEILNPNQEHHQKACNEIGMVYFEELVKKCDMLVAIPFEDGEFGMGVWREMEVMDRAKGNSVTLQLKNNCLCPVDFRNVRPLSILQTRERVRK
jgi:hypothetical protein